MEKLTLLATELAPWLKSTLKFIADNWKSILLIIGVIVIYYFIEQIFKKKGKYDYKICNGRIKRNLGEAEMITYRKGVYVRIHKITLMYYFKDLDGKWYKLRKKHRDQIDESGKNGGIPEFDIPMEIKKNKKKVAA